MYCNVPEISSLRHTKHLKQTILNMLLSTGRGKNYFCHISKIQGLTYLLDPWPQLNPNNAKFHMFQTRLSIPI